jgi:hypothetical protein
MGSNRPKLQNFKVDCSDIVYTSTVIEFYGETQAYSSGNQFLEFIQLYGPSSTESATTGTAIALIAGANSVEKKLTGVKFRDVYIRGFEYGVFQQADTSSANTFHTFDYTTFRTKHSYWQDNISGALTGTTVKLQANGHTDMYTAIHVEDVGCTFQLNLFDQVLFQGDMLDLRGVGSAGSKLENKGGNTIQIMNENNGHDRGYTRCDSIGHYAFISDRVNKIVHDFATQIPNGAGAYWLYFDSGTGTSTTSYADGGIITLSTQSGLINGDAYITSPNRFIQPGIKRYPWFEWEFRFDATADYGNSLTKMGFEGLGEEYWFVADPTDSLGSGITTNWIFRTDDGTTVTNTDTGVSFQNTTFEHFQVTFVGKDEDRVRAAIDNQEVADVSLAGTRGNLAPWVGIEALEALKKEIQLTDFFNIRWTELF